ncbi:MAG: hypothetical protein OXQ29_06785 [Rhodospirillaceae bacterium]|nr:hypothetical protein [Rhodospirillaceae bacterium]
MNGWKEIKQSVESAVSALRGVVNDTDRGYGLWQDAPSGLLHAGSIESEVLAVFMYVARLGETDEDTPHFRDEVSPLLRTRRVGIGQVLDCVELSLSMLSMVAVSSRGIYGRGFKKAFRSYAGEFLMKAQELKMSGLRYEACMLVLLDYLVLWHQSDSFGVVDRSLHEFSRHVAIRKQKRVTCVEDVPRAA